MDTFTNEPVTDESIIDLTHYVSLLRARLWPILATVLVAALAAYVASRLSTPIYRATTKIFVDLRLSTNSTDLVAIRASESLAQTYAELVMSRDVLEQTRAMLSSNLSIKDIESGLTATPLVGTQLIEIRVENPNPELAANIANGVTLVFMEQVRALQVSGYGVVKDNLFNQLADLQEQIGALELSLSDLATQEGDTPSVERARVERLLSQANQNYSALLQSYQQVQLAEVESTSNIMQIDQARVPGRPIRPNIPLNTVTGAAVGLLLAVGVIFVRDLFDNTLKKVDEVTRHLHLPTVAEIGRFDAEASPLIVATEPRAPASERFRALRLNIKYATVGHTLKKILVTSVQPGEGKTTTAANLSVVLASGGQRVILVDGDLRRPRVHAMFGLRNRSGLSDAFISDEGAVGYLQDTPIANLRVLVSGPLPPNPAELLDNPRTQEILDELATQADVVIVDAPPALELTDAVALSRYVDGVIFVARVAHTRLDAAKRVIQKLRSLGAYVIGTVLVDVDGRAAAYGGYYYNYQDYYSDEQPRSRFGGERLRRRKAVNGDGLNGLEREATETRE